MPRKVATYRPVNAEVNPPRPCDRTEGRREAKRFYASERWRRLRALFLRENPLCAACERNGRTTAARHVHHKRKRQDHPDLALDWDNLEALCQPCHSIETGEGK